VQEALDEIDVFVVEKKFDLAVAACERGVQGGGSTFLLFVFGTLLAFLVFSSTLLILIPPPSLSSPAASRLSDAEPNDERRAALQKLLDERVSRLAGAIWTLLKTSQFRSLSLSVGAAVKLLIRLRHDEQARRVFLRCKSIVLDGKMRFDVFDEGG
jgi:hypothetical protein